MSYVRRDFKSKKDFKASIAFMMANGGPAATPNGLTRDLTIMPTSIIGDGPINGRAFIEGPHYPAPHRWYAQVEVTAGVVTKFIS